MAERALPILQHGIRSCMA